MQIKAGIVESMLTARKSLVLLAISAMVLLAVGVRPALAAQPTSGYGSPAVHQVELSANIPGTSGGGVWLWLGLYADHSVDYSGSDCPHKLPGVGAASDMGDATWKYIDNGNKIEIDGVLLQGFGGYPTTITIPAQNGHYVGDANDYLTLPITIPDGVGTSQLQVAP